MIKNGSVQEKTSRAGINMRFADMGPFQFTSSDYMYELLGIKLVIIKGLTENGIVVNPNTDGMVVVDTSLWAPIQYVWISMP
jgi:hypothetical protein